MGDISVQESIRGIVYATAVEEVWKILLDAVQTAGFDNVLYGFTRFHTDYGFGDDNDHLFLTNFNRDYMQGYFLEGRYRNGPLVRWAVDNAGVCSWRWVQDHYHELSDAEREVADFNWSKGVTAGYTIAFPNSLRRYKGAIGMSLAPGAGTQEDADAIWARHGEALELLSCTAHLKLISMPLPRRMLTKRQREVLEWIADGKTVGDIAQILGLNRATVEKHLRLARESLGVETTAQALLKASLHNHIFTF